LDGNNIAERSDEVTATTTIMNAPLPEDAICTGWEALKVQFPHAVLVDIHDEERVAALQY
jgi:hypothetical protein